jgi:hypothetical protein
VAFLSISMATTFHSAPWAHMVVGGMVRPDTDDPLLGFTDASACPYRAGNTIAPMLQRNIRKYRRIGGTVKQFLLRRSIGVRQPI